MLKNENSELVRRINQARNEQKVTQIRYEKLEKAFASSIQRIMANSNEVYFNNDNDDIEGMAK